MIQVRNQSRRRTRTLALQSRLFSALRGNLEHAKSVKGTEADATRIAAAKQSIESELLALGFRMEPSLAACANEGHAIIEVSTEEMVDADDDIPPRVLALATAWSMIEGPVFWPDVAAQDLQVARDVLGEVVLTALQSAATTTQQPPVAARAKRRGAAASAPQ